MSIWYQYTYQRYLWALQKQTGMTPQEAIDLMNRAAAGDLTARDQANAAVAGAGEPPAPIITTPADLGNLNPYQDMSIKLTERGFDHTVDEANGVTKLLDPKYVADGWLIFGKAYTDLVDHEGGQQIHPQDHFPFSPLPNNPMSMEGAALFLIVANFSRSEEGRKQLQQIAIKYLDSCARIIEAAEDACHSNWLTALNNQHITAAISHRLGLMADGDYMRVLKHYQSVFDKMFASEMLSTVNETIRGVSTLVQGSKYTTGQGGVESGQGLSALANILSAKP